MQGVSSGLVQALQSLYRGSSACVKINGAYIDWFDIRKGVRQSLGVMVKWWVASPSGPEKLDDGEPRRYGKTTMITHTEIAFLL
ncbi:hypothetical protein EVAR_44430_1 [Eumeta japonica]|uniref:Uncharacterized protein n=1 Tax=Eumeta variegata TaxID=151549 RepID=A0A4C1XWC1_EUMVA|nr:hypothetical protein EVAR_44430_1 [Eumeta japonica]